MPRLDEIRPTQPVKLYSKAIVTGYRRSHHLQAPSQTLLKIEGVNTKEDATFYLGKRVAYIYKAKTKPARGRNKDSPFRVIWGRVATTHGGNGMVRARFRNNLPPSAFGKSARVMLYPSTI